MKTPISYYGGKQQLLPTILPLIPKHRVYTEVFFGGGAVYWAKEKSEVEVINDLNGSVINFYSVLNSDFEELKRLIEQTLYSRALYKQAITIYELPHLFPSVTRAWAFWVATQAGFSRKIGSWAAGKSGKEESVFQNRIKAFSDMFSQRLKFTSIESEDACKILQYRDVPDAFHYVDPPYLDCNQGHYAGYLQEDFNRLLDQLEKCQGKFLLSTYPNAELTERVAKNGWYQKEIVMHLACSNRAGKNKVEVLTANYPIL